MTKSKFQLVGSLLRPADLRKYKDEIEQRDDIQYPFYDALPDLKELNATLLSMATLLKTMMVVNMKHVKISVFASLSRSQVRTTIT